MNGKTRSTIKPGLRVKIVQKQDQRSGKLTEGVVRELLTNSPTHPHGIKVRLVSGEVGRVQEIILPAVPPPPAPPPASKNSPPAPPVPPENDNRSSG